LNILKDLKVTDYICLETADELDKVGHYELNLSKDQQFHHFPIPDRSVVDDHIMIDYMKQIYDLLITTDKIIYIHCLGGHGRTGVVVSLFLAHKYNISSSLALQLCQILHDARWIKTGKVGQPFRFKSPQTRSQIAQVHRLATI